MKSMCRDGREGMAHTAREAGSRRGRMMNKKAATINQPMKATNLNLMKLVDTKRSWTKMKIVLIWGKPCM